MTDELPPDEVMESTCEREAARLLPWFVAGTLSEQDSLRVQRHLQECRICAADERREARLRELVSSAPTVEHAPQPGLQKLVSRIDELERELPSQLDEPRGPATPLAARPVFVRWLAAAVLLQSIGLGVLGALLWQASQMQAPRFTTLSSPAQRWTGAAHVRVVFAPAMTVGEVQALLASIPATVAAGPSEAGVYTLALENKQEDVGAVLARLRATQGVLFAEPQSPPEQRQ